VTTDIFVIEQWLEAKEDERKATERRRAIEDLLVTELKISEAAEGTANFDLGDYKVKVVSKLNRKIDGDKLQEVAAEAGLSEHLSDLFRWKPELNMTAWKRADNTITEALSAAITTTPGRPAFTITKE